VVKVAVSILCGELGDRRLGGWTGRGDPLTRLGPIGGLDSGVAGNCAGSWLGHPCWQAPPGVQRGGPRLMLQ
jgi:hypothetical protein